MLLLQLLLSSYLIQATKYILNLKYNYQVKLHKGSIVMDR